jgi:hypothetical protein
MQEWGRPPALLFGRKSLGVDSESQGSIMLGCPGSQPQAGGFSKLQCPCRSDGLWCTVLSAPGAGAQWWPGWRSARDNGGIGQAHWAGQGSYRTCPLGPAGGLGSDGRDRASVGDQRSWYCHPGW